MASETAVKCFLLSGKYKSFSKAADKLFMTRQAVSQQICALEKELGYKLFERNAKGVLLTPVGELYYAYFEKAMREWAEVGYEAKKLSSRKQNSIRLGCLHDIDMGVQIKALEEFARLRETSFEVSWERGESREIMERLIDGELDAVFVFEREKDNFPRLKNFFDSCFFERTQAYIVVSSDYENLPEEDYLEFFSAQPCLLAKKMIESDENERGFAGEFSDYGLNLKNIRLLSNRESVRTMVYTGAGFTICTSMESIIKSPGIKAYPIEKYVNIFLVWRKNETNTLVKEFINSVRNR